MNEGLRSSGRIDLSVTGERYRLYQEAPLYLNILKKKMIEAYPTDQGGGMRGGDCHAVSISVSDKSGLLWSAPASTLCFPSMYDDEPCALLTDIHLYDSGKLYYINKPVIPTKNARVNQTTIIDIDELSSLFFVDIFCSGRIAHEDERWGFSCFKNHFELCASGETLYRENWELSASRIPSGSAEFNDLNIYATIIAKGINPARLIERSLSMLKPDAISIALGELSRECYILKALYKTGIYIDKFMKEIYQYIIAIESEEL